MPQAATAITITTPFPGRPAPASARPARRVSQPDELLLAAAPSRASLIALPRDAAPRLVDIEELADVINEAVTVSQQERGDGGQMQWFDAVAAARGLVQHLAGNQDELA